jgi:bifunctional non-homologous end joining protein LigD
VRSRRGWNMTPELGFLAELPVEATLDGELVAFGSDGKPDFPSLWARMLHRHAQIPLTFVIFDVLSLEGRDVTRRPYRERRRILEQLDFAAPQWFVPEVFRER